MELQGAGDAELTSSAYLKVRGGTIVGENNGGFSVRSNGSGGDVTRNLISASNGGDVTNRAYDENYSNVRAVHIDSRRAALYDLP